MSDRSKAIMALTNAKYVKKNYIKAKAEMSFEFIDMLIELLKEHEATPNIFDGGVKQWFTCGKCGETIHDHDKYCSQCGTKVSWKWKTV